MIIFPAIDIKDAGVVRLTQGDYGQVERYSVSPVQAAESFFAAGARHLHVVDLDGAKDGSLSNFEAIEKIIKATPMFVEVGGGIRDEERIKRYLDADVGRVILGTAALQSPDFLVKMVEKYGERIAVGVDAKDGFVAVDGWLTVSKTDSVSFCKTVRDMGVKTVIYTDISRDGAMKGTNVEIYRVLNAIGNLNIVASGGVSSLDDVSALRGIGTHAAIIGKALYTGKIDLSAALKAAQ